MRIETIKYKFLKDCHNLSMAIFQEVA